MPSESQAAGVKQAPACAMSSEASADDIDETGQAAQINEIDQAKTKGRRNPFAPPPDNRKSDHYWNRRRTIHAAMARAKSGLNVDSFCVMMSDTGAYSWTTSGNHVSELLLLWAAYERKRREQNNRLLKFSLEELDSRFRGSPHGLRYMISVASTLEKDFGIPQKLVADVHEVYRNMVGAYDNGGRDARDKLQKLFMDACRKFVDENSAFAGMPAPAAETADVPVPAAPAAVPTTAQATAARAVQADDGASSSSSSAEAVSTSGDTSKPARAHATRFRKRLTNRDLTYYTYEGDPHPAVVALADDAMLDPIYITWKLLKSQGWTYSEPLEGTFYFVPSDAEFENAMLDPDEVVYPGGHVDVAPQRTRDRHKKCIGGYNVFRELYQLKEIVFKLQGGGESQ